MARVFLYFLHSVMMQIIICRPFSIAFFLYGQSAEIYQNVIKTMQIPKRMNIIPHFSENAEPYPINMLRNIALDQVQTSHLWLADMDMWPASTYETHGLQNSGLIQDHCVLATIVLSSR